MHPIVDKNSFHTKSIGVHKVETQKRSAENDYVFGAYAEEIAIRYKGKRRALTKDMCSQALEP